DLVNKFFGKITAVAAAAAIAAAAVVFDMPKKVAAKGTDNCDGTHSGWSETAALPTTNGNYILTQDISTEYGVDITGKVNLCLNGHSVSTSGLSAVYIKPGAELNLYDCGTGKIVGISVDSGGTLNMYGGIVADCTIHSGVFNNGTFNMYGGKITNNKAHLDGGGVTNQGVFNMYGGEISNNKANDGGGVFIAETADSAFTMYGGKIINNTANGVGGGIYIGQDKSITLSGGEISGNTASDKGGGIYLGKQNSVLNASGSVTVFDNSAKSKPNNIWKIPNSVINITDRLMHSKLGISTYEIYCFAPNVITSAADDYSGCFFSDAEDYRIAAEENNGVYNITLMKPHNPGAVWKSNATQHWHVCANEYDFGSCGDHVDKSDHKWNDGDVTKAPTCTENGIKTLTCKVCGRTKTEDVEARHTLTEIPVKEPTETEEGVKKHWHCDGCGKDFSDENGENEASENDLKIPYIEVKVTVAENAPAASVNASKSEIFEAVSEAKNVDKYNHIKITLKVEDAEDTVAPSDKASAEEALEDLEGFEMGHFIDISLIMEVISADSATSTAIHETEKPLEITIEIPESILGKDQYKVIRVHEGVSEILDDLDANPDTITITTNKFSSYSLIYSESKSGDGEGSGGSNGSGGVNDAQAPTVRPIPSDEAVSAENTVTSSADESTAAEYSDPAAAADTDTAGADSRSDTDSDGNPSTGLVLTLAPTAFSMVICAIFKKKRN
ncbi:MAG: hypothetical protein NC203_11905, partial [Firmicutes bacterium]|nr:hypothetical protein [Bacillota bacterium]